MYRKRHGEIIFNVIGTNKWRWKPRCDPMNTLKPFFRISISLINNFENRCPKLKPGTNAKSGNPGFWPRRSSSFEKESRVACFCFSLRRAWPPACSPARPRKRIAFFVHKNTHTHNMASEESQNALQSENVETSGKNEDETIPTVMTIPFFFPTCIVTSVPTTILTSVYFRIWIVFISSGTLLTLWCTSHDFYWFYQTYLLMSWLVLPVILFSL